jgi:putative oxidoreductase
VAAWTSEEVHPTKAEIKREPGGNTGFFFVSGQLSDRHVNLQICKNIHQKMANILHCAKRKNGVCSITKRAFPKETTMNNPALNDAAKLVGRLLLVLIFIQAGYGKIGGYEGTVKYMASAGVPGLLLPLVIAVELGAGLLVAIGYQTRLAALALAGFSILSALLFHFNFGDRMQATQFMKNVSIAGGFLMLFAAGAGSWSVDGHKGS